MDLSLCFNYVLTILVYVYKYITFNNMQDSRMVIPIAGEIEIRTNVLVLRRLNKARDEGMYQCAATNTFGTSMSSAQLRVLCTFVSGHLVSHNVPNCHVLFERELFYSKNTISFRAIRLHFFKNTTFFGIVF